MGRSLTDDLKVRLNGRTKHELIEGMIVRSPHQMAAEKMVAALEVYPLLLLLLAHDHPTKIWILDRGEAPSSAEILNDSVRQKRWHAGRLCIDDCDGITEVVGNYVAVVVSWRTLLAMRHEFAHAVTTFFSPTTRQKLNTLYREAKTRGAFTEPLASESIGEYVACGLSYFFFPDLREELKEVDPDLHDLVEDLLRQADEISEMISEPAPHPAKLR
ncbi:MAG: hypothetical protein M1343_05585 [Chloroflexi bacterium]|nr:hypothetical protein [Chloroflexota bacterium]